MFSRADCLPVRHGRDEPGHDDGENLTPTLVPRINMRDFMRRMNTFSIRFERWRHAVAFDFILALR
jgi:hypothetical protein